MEIIPLTTNSPHRIEKRMNPLSKIFAILETVVAGQDKGVTYSEIVAARNLPKSSVHRILKDLTEIGYLNFNPETKKYFGSFRLAALGAEIMSQFHLREHIRPFLLSLQRETEHTINLGVLDGRVGVFVDKLESRDFGIKLFSEIGKTFPLHCTGLGKSLLAYSTEEIVEQLLAQKLEAVTDRTITDPDDFRRELASIRHQGYAVDDQEITRGIMCAAAPVFGFDGKVMCAVSITFPAYLNDDRGIEPEIEAIRKCANQISDSLSRR